MSTSYTPSAYPFTGLLELHKKGKIDDLISILIQFKSDQALCDTNCLSGDYAWEADDRRRKLGNEWFKLISKDTTE